MNSANRLEMLDHHRVGGQHRFELLAAARGRLDLKSRRRAVAWSSRSPVGNRPARLDAEVDAIERAAAAEHLLRRVDVHDREIAAERARRCRRSS